MSNETNPVVGLVVPTVGSSLSNFTRSLAEAREHELRAVAAASVYADHSDAAAAADAGSDFIESALGAAPTVAEMTADLGKLTLPEVIYVKDCECASRPRFSTKAGDPTCEECGKAWTRTYGPSNDAPVEVQIEIRAAELSGSSRGARDEEEWSGWDDYPDFGDPKTDANWAGWLCCAILEHDYEIEDGE